MVEVVDGDTVNVVADNGAPSVVRLIGIDTPEMDSCEGVYAQQVLHSLIGGKQVNLVLGGDGEDTDKYGRLLRYVDSGTTDAGLAMIANGNAIARYDSRDGYGGHDREINYIAVDDGQPQYTCPPPPPPAPHRRLLPCQHRRRRPRRHPGLIPLLAKRSRQLQHLHLPHRHRPVLSPIAMRRAPPARPRSTSANRATHRSSIVIRTASPASDGGAGPAPWGGHAHRSGLWLIDARPDRAGAVSRMRMMPSLS